MLAAFGPGFQGKGCFLIVAVPDGVASGGFRNTLFLEPL
jgi:hypothetical protein